MVTGGSTSSPRAPPDLSAIAPTRASLATPRGRRRHHGVEAVFFAPASRTQSPRAPARQWARTRAPARVRGSESGLVAPTSGASRESAAPDFFFFFSVSDAVAAAWLVRWTFGDAMPVYLYVNENELPRPWLRGWFVNEHVSREKKIAPARSLTVQDTIRVRTQPQLQQHDDRRAHAREAYSA